ncbi:MAG: YezD family protein [Nitrospira sp.]|nr:YezD family protein [Nitrospira sp.]
MELTGKSPKDVDEVLRNAIKNIRFGSIEIIIHDSKIVQIERKEKFPLDTTSTRPHQ